MHEKTSVPALIEEIYTFLRQADAKELNDLFRALKKANEAGDTAKAAEITAQIDSFPNSRCANYCGHRCWFR